MFGLDPMIAYDHGRRDGFLAGVIMGIGNTLAFVFIVWALWEWAS